jgi:ribonuclease-3
MSTQPAQRPAVPRASSELEEAMGYHFQNPALLLQALTHSSHSEESPGSSRKPFNEQMEFLGDSVLGFLVAETLVRMFPQYREGKLSKLKARLVSAAHLHPVAESLKLGQFLYLGKGEERSGGRAKKALLVDTLEAVVAAVYLDGGLIPARRFVEQWVLNSVDWDRFPAADYKSELQELLQERHAPAPRYLVVRERGPEHHKMFTVQLHVGGEQLAQGEGNSKKAAQQAAAQVALTRLRENHLALENRTIG